MAQSIDGCTVGDATRPLVVVVAETRWEEPPRMRHQVVRQLLRWFNVVFVEWCPTWKPRALKDQWQTVNDQLSIYTPHCRFPVPPRLYANVPLVHTMVNRDYAQRIRAVIRQHPGPVKILLNFANAFPEIMKSSDADFKLYMCVDEFPCMWRQSERPWEPKYSFHRRYYQALEDAVARAADICIATHTPLQEKLRRINPECRLLLHAHEFDTTPRALLCQSSKSARLKVGFMGYVDYKLMTDWLMAVAQQEDMELSLIGPVVKFESRGLVGRGNFRFVPPLTGTELLAALTEMDVLIMPYDPKIPECWVQTVSNKFFQYVAAGRPVVISDLPHYIKMPHGVLYRAKTAGQFVEAIRRAKAEDSPAMTAMRYRIAARNTWDRRGKKLYTLIRTGLERKGKEWGSEE